MDEITFESHLIKFVGQKEGLDPKRIEKEM